MEALIDLKTIQRLKTETEAYWGYISASSLGYAPTPKLEPALFQSMMQTYVQADNLNTQLRSLHQSCLDYSMGHFEPYMDEFNRIRRERGMEKYGYDPFDHLSHYFDPNFHTCLPAKIEQYADLLVAIADPVKYFPRPTNGLPIMISGYELELPEMEIKDALNGYNQFRAECQRLIEAYRPGGDVEACATEILKLFK